MAGYLREIEEIILREVARETAHLQAERDRAIAEAKRESQMRDTAWREAHVAERIAEYRARAHRLRIRVNDLETALQEIAEEVREPSHLYTPGTLVHVRHLATEALGVERAAPKPEPHDCTSCGTSNGACMARINESGRGCCATCYRTDTHGALQGGQ